MCPAMMSDSNIETTVELTMMILIDNQVVHLQGANTPVQGVQTAPSM